MFLFRPLIQGAGQVVATCPSGFQDQFLVEMKEFELGIVLGWYKSRLVAMFVVLGLVKRSQMSVSTISGALQVPCLCYACPEG